LKAIVFYFNGVVLVEIVKIGKKEYIKVSGTDDPLATKLRRFYKKSGKKSK